MPGPLDGITVLELAAIGPAPFGVMLLADLGAQVIRVDRIAAARGNPGSEASMHGLNRGRRSVGVDLKSDQGTQVVLDLVERCDVLVEGMRPGVAERLGVGPEPCFERNPALIYARMTGWGQEGPLADQAGHDIDYAAISGALHPIGRADSPPPPPLNLLSDFAGGGSYLALGVVAALFERVTSGQGQVIDAAMVDGTVNLTAFVHGLLGLGMWTTERQANLLDGGSPFYDTYACSDGRYIAVGAIEPQFYAALLDGLGLDPDEVPQHDHARQRERFTALFASRTRDEWAEHFAGTDACVAPVLSLEEAREHPHNVARGLFTQVEGGGVQPAPAPRFSRTPLRADRPVPAYGAHTDEVLGELGYAPAHIASLRASGAVA
ncbi:MAG TPA: CaiB/BaiF CoA-transferase family protein [Nitriliruptorales bacterium]